MNRQIALRNYVNSLAQSTDHQLASALERHTMRGQVEIDAAMSANDRADTCLQAGNYESALGLYESAAEHQKEVIDIRLRITAIRAEQSRRRAA